MQLRPARAHNVIEQPADGEVVVYNLDNDQVSLLNPVTAAVWRRCDGQSTVSVLAGHIARDLGMPADDDLVWAALAELDRAALLSEPLGARAPTISRRDLVRRLAIGAAALPLVTSIVAPTAAAASSHLPPGCASDGDCGPDETCVDGTCLGDPAPLCVTNDDCGQGFICQGGTCVPAQVVPGSCITNDDCPPLSVCVNGLCLSI